MTENLARWCIEPLRFPARIENRPGLSTVAYRLGSYTTIRAALHRWLDEDPLLAGWTHRASDDPGIALLDGAAILGDILTMYQQVYANEVYLPTARRRDSVADLVRLLGYRLSPGLAGRGTFAFEVRGTLPVTIPKGFPVTADLAGVDDTVDLEIAEDVVAYPWLGKFSLGRPTYTPNLSSSTTELVIYSGSADLAAGDRIMIGRPYPASNPNRIVGGEIVVIDGVRERQGQKLYKIKGALVKSVNLAEVIAFKLGRTFRHVGHAAPPTKTVVSGGVASTPSISYTRLLNGTTSTDVQPSLESDDIPLTPEATDLAIGSTLIFQSVMRRLDGSITRYTPTELMPFRTLTGFRQGSITWGALTSPATLATIASALTTSIAPSVDSWHPHTHTYDRVDVREMQIHETVGEHFTMRAAPKHLSTPKGHDLFFFGTGAEVKTLKGRRLLLVKPGEEPEIVNVTSVESSSGAAARGRRPRRISIDAQATYSDFSVESSAVVVFGNLADATQGKTQREAVLGNGDSRADFQTFKIPKSPLTYLLRSGETPPETPELAIFVEGREWTRVSSLYGRRPKEEIYIVREDARGDSWVQFGNNRTGKRLPSGIGNVVARFRVGSGAHGPMKPGASPQAAGRLDGLDKLALADVVSGGAPPESGDEARAAGPAKAQSLDRLVTLADIEAEAQAIAGVARASAAWRLVDGVPAVVVVLLMETGRASEIEAVRTFLAEAARCRGPNRSAIVVVQGLTRWVRLDLTVALAAGRREDLVVPQVRAALGAAGVGDPLKPGLFAAARRRFGEAEYVTRIEATAQNVDGVSWARVDRVGSLGTSDDPASLAVPPTAPPAQSVACPKTQMLGLYPSHLALSLVLPPAEVCS